MAFDSTPGSTTANSYLSVARADELATEHPYATAWIDLAADTPRKQALLIMATRRIDNALCPPGTALNANQALKQPRTGQTNGNGYEYPSNVIPLPVELATFEDALALATSNVTQPSAASVQGLTRLKAGSVELVFKDEIVYRTLAENVKVLLPSTWLCENQPDTSYFVFEVV
jgi:hypothetical protein